MQITMSSEMFVPLFFTITHGNYQMIHDFLMVTKWPIECLWSDQKRVVMKQECYKMPLPTDHQILSDGFDILRSSTEINGKDMHSVELYNTYR